VLLVGGVYIWKRTARLEQTAEALSRAQRIAHLGNWEWRIPEDAMTWSDETYRIFGLPPEAFEATHEAFIARVHPADRALVEAAVRRAIEDEAPFSIVHRIVRAGGEERVVHELAEVTFGPGDEPLLMAGTVNDITSPKHAEAEEVRARDFCLKTLDEMPTPIWRAGADGSIDYFNRAWFAFTGMQRNPAGFESWTEGIHPEDRERVRTVLRAALASREPFETEFRLKHADGAFKYVLDVGIPFSGLDGAFAGYIGSCYDITRHRVLEDRISASLREKEMLISEIHHRVNNNMQIIISLLRLHARLIRDPEDQKIFQECQARIRTMALVHDLIYQSRNFAEIDLSAYTKQIVGNLTKALGISPSRIAVRIEMEQTALGIDTAIPCGMIINEMLSNAFAHAFLCGRSGSILISLARTSPRSFLLRVLDDGVGPPEGFSVETAPTFGMEMLRTLASQLGSSVTLRRTDGSTSFEVAFTEIAYRPRI
jgi:PAS domain S-box-containing protein